MDFLMKTMFRCALYLTLLKVKVQGMFSKNEPTKLGEFKKSPDCLRQIKQKSKKE